MHVRWIRVLPLAVLATSVWGAELAPFYPAARDGVTGLAVGPAQFASASDCAHCHPLQHEQWSGSMHANAYADPLYQAAWREASRDGKGVGDAFCAGCHTPVGALGQGTWIRQSGEIVIHPRAQEGVTCDFCHTVVRAKILEKGGAPGDAGLTLEPEGPKRGPYAEASDAFHAVAFSDLHTRSEFCGACHNVFHPVSNSAIARTYEEWKESVYAEKEIQCQDCHMVPTDVAARVAATLEKPVREGLTSRFQTIRSPFFDHTFTGANVAMPALLQRWMHSEDARLRLHIAARLAVAAPAEARPGAPIGVEVRVENVGAGHNLPTSMTEIREVWLEVAVRDEGDGGKVLWQTGALDDKGHLGADVRRYGARALDGEGKPTWKPWKVTTIEKDTSIRPKSAAVETFEVPLPDGARGPLKVTARLRYRSFSQEIADEYLEEKGYTVPAVDMATREALVKITRP